MKRMTTVLVAIAVVSILTFFFIADDQPVNNGYQQPPVTDSSANATDDLPVMAAGILIWQPFR